MAGRATFASGTLGNDNSSFFQMRPEETFLRKSFECWSLHEYFRCDTQTHTPWTQFEAH